MALGLPGFLFPDSAPSSFMIAGPTINYLTFVIATIGCGHDCHFMTTVRLGIMGGGERVSYRAGSIPLSLIFPLSPIWLVSRYFTLAGRPPSVPHLQRSSVVYLLAKTACPFLPAALKWLIPCRDLVLTPPSLPASAQLMLPPLLLDLTFIAVLSFKNKAGYFPNFKEVSRLEFTFAPCRAY